jgi:hypothetical protein
MIAFVLATSLAAVDWVMSLEPLFFSTVFGLILLVGQIGTAFALGILVTAFSSPNEPLNSARHGPRHDLGNFLLMSVMLWAYLSFSQLILIWSGQLPEEIMFYNYRFSGGWQWVGILLIIGHFALPFGLLLFSRLKRHRHALAAIAVLVLVSRWLDLVWLVQPNVTPGRLVLPWMMLVLPLGLTSLWLGGFLYCLEGVRRA